MKFDIETKRKEQGLTLEEIAKYVGVSKSTVKKWESGYIKNMRRDKISKLAAILGVSPVEILDADLSVQSSTSQSVSLTAPIKEELQKLAKKLFHICLSDDCAIVIKENKVFFINSSPQQTAESNTIAKQ